MAVGKGSMERAAKAAGTDASIRKSANKAVGSKKAAVERTTVKSSVIVTEKKPESQIVYQKSSGMLERAAEPNERFELGDDMPVYFF